MYFQIVCEWYICLCNDKAYFAAIYSILLIHNMIEHCIMSYNLQVIAFFRLSLTNTTTDLHWNLGQTTNHNTYRTESNCISTFHHECLRVKICVLCIACIIQSPFDCPEHIENIVCPNSSKCLFLWSERSAHSAKDLSHLVRLMIFGSHPFVDSLARHSIIQKVTSFISHITIHTKPFESNKNAPKNIFKIIEFFLNFLKCVSKHLFTSTNKTKKHKRTIRCRWYKNVCFARKYVARCRFACVLGRGLFLWASAPSESPIRYDSTSCRRTTLI